MERLGKIPTKDTLSSPSDSEGYVEGWEVTYHDIVIIIIPSSISVILIITTISVIILKVRYKISNTNTKTSDQNQIQEQNEAVQGNAQNWF